MFAKLIAALEEIQTLFADAAPLGLAALAALRAGGLKGLLTFLESLVITPIPGAPSADKLQKAIATLKPHV